MKTIYSLIYSLPKGFIPMLFPICRIPKCHSDPFSTHIKGDSLPCSVASLEALNYSLIIASTLFTRILTINPCIELGRSSSVTLSQDSLHIVNSQEILMPITLQKFPSRHLILLLQISF